MGGGRHLNGNVLPPPLAVHSAWPRPHILLTLQVWGGARRLPSLSLLGSPQLLPPPPSPPPPPTLLPLLPLPLPPSPSLLLPLPSPPPPPPLLSLPLALPPTRPLSPTSALPAGRGGAVTAVGRGGAGGGAFATWGRQAIWAAGRPAGRLLPPTSPPLGPAPWAGERIAERECACGGMGDAGRRRMLLLAEGTLSCGGGRRATGRGKRVPGREGVG